MFKLATSRISIPGVHVEPFALFGTLDGANTADYVQRVEPSSAGGRKMAAALMDAILEGDGGSSSAWSEPDGPLIATISRD